MPDHVTHWWWPLTRWWGVCGVIIFIGLAMQVIEYGTKLYAEQISPVAQGREMQSAPKGAEQRSSTSPRGRITP
jgi:hypothetical protein